MFHLSDGALRTKKTASVQPRWIFLIILLLWAAAARVWLVFNLPIRLLPYDVHEDGLFIRIAADPASGIWLGKFNQLALLKGPGYPFFLAVTSFSGLPLSASHALFQTVAISVTAWAVFRLTRSRASAAATFIALAFCPVGLALHRVLPDQIYLGTDTAGLFAVRDNPVDAAASPRHCDDCCRSRRIGLRLDMAHRGKQPLVYAGISVLDCWRHF